MKLARLALTTALCACAGDKAQFTKTGELIAPSGYREWTFLSSGLGMTYGPNAPAAGSPLAFDNVYANPSSYREFIQTGKWPDGTVLILEIRGSESKGSINQHGHFQSSLRAVEAHVKDTRRFGGRGWAFFDIPLRDGKMSPSAKILPAGNSCEKCHSKSGAVEGTFVQFYPELIPVAKRSGTFRQPAGE